MSTPRRLAADVVGYSRLVSAAEADALARSDTPDVKSSSDAVTSVHVQVFGCRHDEAIHALRWPASEKRQGTKSREVGHRRSSGRYGDL
jgi:hypothetical protein